MATSLPVDPIAYSHPTELTIRGQYGPDYYHRFTYWQNPTRLPSGNPVVGWSHGGAWRFGGYNSNVEAPSATKILRAYLGDVDNYGTGDLACDFVSFETRLYAHEGYSAAPFNSPYEVTLEGVHNGTGPISLPATGCELVDDHQRFAQFLKDRAGEFGCDPDRVGLGGESAGAHLALCAGMTPSRPFTIRSLSGTLYPAFSNSRIRCVIAWVPVIDVHPFWSFHGTTRPLFGIHESDNARVKAAMERLLLHKDASGVYSVDSALKPLGARLSPVQLALNSPAEVRGTDGLRVFSVFDWNDQDETVCAGYSSVPPYYNPHDPRQRSRLAGTLSSVGIFHDGLILDLDDFSGNRQLFYEATLEDTYDFLVESFG